MTVHPVWAQVIGVFTLLTMLTFIGIWLWVWNRHHKSKYDALARMPMEDEPNGRNPAQDEENRP